MLRLIDTTTDVDIDLADYLIEQGWAAPEEGTELNVMNIYIFFLTEFLKPMDRLFIAGFSFRSDPAPMQPPEALATVLGVQLDSYWFLTQCD